MGYEINRITLAIENNYLTIAVDEGTPKGEEPVLPPRITDSFFPKASATFNLTYKLVEDEKKGAEVWTVHSINIVHGTGQNVCVIFASDINAGKVYVGLETTSILALKDFLTTNTGA